MEQVNVLNKHYTKLDYDNDKKKALKEIRYLSETVRFHKSVNFLERTEVLANIIKENISHFKSVCKHVDVIDTILENLTDFNNLNLYIVSTETLKDEYKIVNILLNTLFYICRDSTIRSFLLYPILTDTIGNIKETYDLMNYWNSNIVSEMIIFEDSDLYAVINSLKITNDLPLRKIWVQELVKEKFLWLVKRHYLDVAFSIDTFSSLSDLNIREYPETKIHILSIWSDDIAGIKSLALLIQRHIIFINTHMDFSGGVMLIPHSQIFARIWMRDRLHRICSEESDLTDIEQNVNVVHFSHIAEVSSTSIHNLFYDGSWQEPIKGMYWKHNDYLWAHATNDDIIKCYQSAEKGFQTWSLTSIDTRIKILSRLVHVLNLRGKPILSTIVSRCLKFPDMHSIVQGSVTENRMIEVIQNRMALGVIILREENENVLFFRLMQTLIAGNSVIVIFDANFCNLTWYCDMFSMCEIPSGVINILSQENIDLLEYKLCLMKYSNYADQIFSKGNSLESYIATNYKLTMCKYIVLHLK